MAEEAKRYFTVRGIEALIPRLEKIMARVRIMADMSYIREIGEAWEYLDIWAAGGNIEATKLLAALKSALGRMGPSLEAIC